jgi:serine/threonine protein kinase
MQGVAENYTCDTIVGTGGFATVFRACHRVAPVRVAIKLIDQAQIDDEKGRTRLMREISLFRQMNHPFIAKLFFVAGQSQNIAIVQEYAAHGTLLDLLTKRGVLHENLIKYYFLQIVSVLDYLHNVRKVTHRDIKLENILLDNFSNIKVIDFGLSRTFINSQDIFSTPCGSPPYIAPELITIGTYTRAADVWSLGIVLYALATGSIPFYHEDLSILSRQITSKRIRYPISLSDDFIDLLNKMLCRDPQNRITIE